MGTTLLNGVTRDATNEYQAALDSARSFGDQQKALDKALRDTGLSMDEVNSVVAEGGDEYNRLIDTLRNMGPEGETVADALAGVRSEIERTAQSGRELPDNYVQAARAIDTLADSASSAEDKLAAMDALMVAMGLRPKDAERAMMDFKESLDKTGQEIEMITRSSDFMGEAMFDASGKLQLQGANQATVELQHKIDGLATDLERAALKGADMDEAVANMEPTLQAIQQAWGLTDEQMGGIRDNLEQIADKSKFAVQLEGADEAAQELSAVLSMLKGAEADQHEIRMDMPSEHVMAALDELGVKVTDLGNGKVSIPVTADTREAITQLEDMAWVVDEAASKGVTIDALLNTEPLQVSKAEADQILAELAITNPSPEAQLIIDKLQNGVQISHGELAALEAVSSTPKADLDPTLFNAKRDGVNTDLTNIDNRTSTADVKANTTDAENKISNLMSSLRNLVGKAWTATVRTVTGHHDGGVVPGFAGGGMVPTMPGAPLSATDPIMGVDGRGAPVARIEPLEYVVNRKATADNLPLLEDINAGRLSMADLPGYADGGVVTAQQMLDFGLGKTVNGYTAARPLQGAPYVFGGSNWGDCSGTTSAFAALAVGMNPFPRKFYTGDEGAWLSSHGFSQGIGPRKDSYAVSYFNGGPGGGHTAASIFDSNGNETKIEMGGYPSEGHFNTGVGAGHSSFTNRYHIALPSSPGGAVSDVPGEEIVGTSTEGVTFTQAGKKRTVDWGTASGLASDVEARAHRNQALARYNAGVYDTGGILRDGQIAVNTSGHDEYVIPPALTNAIVTYLPQYADALPGVTKALNDFTTLGNRIADSGFDRGALTQVGWETTRQAKMDLQNMPADATQYDRWAVYVNRTAGEALMGAATMSNSQWIDAGEKLGLSFLGEYAGGIVRAQEDIEDSYVTQVDAADALVEAQSNLTEAQRELNEAMDGAPELSKKTARKIEDAERKLKEAKSAPASKSDKDGSAKAKKIADAERNLARVREDASDELEKNGAKDAQAILQAREAVTQAEGDLDTAQGVVKAAAAATGQAHIAMAIEVASTVIKVTKRVYEAVKKIVEFERAARIGAAEAHAQSMANMRDLTAAVEQQRNVVGDLTAEMVRMKTQVLDSSWKVRQAQDSVWTAHLEGLVGVRKAEADLQAERDKLNGKQRYNFVGLDTEYDRLIGNVHAGLAGVDGAQADLLDTSMETMVARIRGEENVTDAARMATLSRIAGEEGVEGAAWDNVMKRMEGEKNLSDEAWLESLRRIAAEENVGGAAWDSMLKRLDSEKALEHEARLTNLSRIAGEEGVQGAAWDAVMKRMAGEKDVSDAAWAETLERIAAEEGVGGAAFEMMLARVKHEQQFAKSYGELMAERLKETKGLNDEEAELVRQVFDGKFKDYNDEKASILERREFADAYYAMQKAGMEGVLEEATKTSAELQALHALRAAAEWEREKNVLTAQIASIDATYEQQEAVKKLTRLGRDLNQEIANYNRMVSGTMGMQSDEAILLAEIARVEAENEKARADMKSAEARWGRAFDRNGDGKFFFSDNKGSQKMQAARATIDANDKLLRELNDRLAEIGGSGFELTAEDRHNLKIAGRLMANGENERAQGLIRATTMGRAQDVQTLNSIDKQLQDIRTERQGTYDGILDAVDEYNHMQQRLPLDMYRYRAEGMEASYRSDAEGYREADAATRGAWQDLADWQRQYANDAITLANRNPNSMMMGLNIRNTVGGARNNTLIRMDLTKGALMHSDDVEAAFKRLESEMDGVKIDVRQLQRAGAPTGKTVQLQRAGIRR